MGKLRILSLGWGVQSFTLAAMAAVGEIELDYAVHADTRNERSETYSFAREWTPWLAARGVRVVMVEAPEVPNRITDQWGGLYIPAFVKGSSKNGGRLRRQCTYRWKITPIRQWITQEMRRRAMRKTPGTVEMLLGISLDEFQRMRESDVKYIRNCYPLIERRMTRNDCAKWLAAHGLPSPVKSACVFCPYHSKAEWREIRGGEDWTRAVEIDIAIRQRLPPYDLFVHQARVPLEQVDLKTPEEKGQLNLWNEECSGICGV